MYIYIHIHTYLYVCIYMNIFQYMYIYIYIFWGIYEKSLFLRACVHVCAFLCARMCAFNISKYKTWCTIHRALLIQARALLI